MPGACRAAAGSKPDGCRIEKRQAPDGSRRAAGRHLRRTAGDPEKAREPQECGGSFAGGGSFELSWKIKIGSTSGGPVIFPIRPPAPARARLARRSRPFILPFSHDQGGVGKFFLCSDQAGRCRAPCAERWR